MMTERRYQVRWSVASVGDLEEIVSFIAKDSPANARRLLTRLRQRATSLETSPERGRVVPELAFFGIRVFRELIVKPYRILYRVRADSVLVLALFDARRDLETILLERLVRHPDSKS